MQMQIQALLTVAGEVRTGDTATKSNLGPYMEVDLSWHVDYF